MSGCDADHGHEIWALYQGGALTPEVVLSGRFRGARAIRCARVDQAATL